ncbi:MAG TPA: hypothetical protein ENI64_13485 [Gammaproteobacteria bacterium]|nr:hypothetical protein [Gammaproteobacteria bacterium]
MVDPSNDKGVIQVLAHRMETQRLPAILSIKERVEQGEPLSNNDVQFLKQVFQDAQSLKPLVDRHPEWQPLVAKMIHLYKHITDLALENENASGRGR